MFTTGPFVRSFYLSSLISHTTTQYNNRQLREHDNYYVTIISFQLLLPLPYYLSTSSCFHSFVLLLCFDAHLVIVVVFSVVLWLYCIYNITHFCSHSHFIFYNSPKFQLKFFCKFRSLLSLFLYKYNLLLCGSWSLGLSCCGNYVTLKYGSTVQKHSCLKLI